MDLHHLLLAGLPAHSAYPLIATDERTLPDVSNVPRGDSCTAANQHPYSITSSARASRAGGTMRPSALAVLRLIASSYLVGTCTGRSAGFSPLRMRPA